MSWRRFGEASRSGTRRSGGAAPGATLRARSPAWAERQPAPRPMELLLCLNRLAVSIIFFFVSSLPPPYWATKKKGRGGSCFQGVFLPLIPCPHSLAALGLARRQGLERGCIRATHGLAPAYTRTVRHHLLPPPPPFPALQYT